MFCLLLVFYCCNIFLALSKIRFILFRYISDLSLALNLQRSKCDPYEEGLHLIIIMYILNYNSRNEFHSSLLHLNCGFFVLQSTDIVCTIFCLKFELCTTDVCNCYKKPMKDKQKVSQTLPSCKLCKVISFPFTRLLSETIYR